MQLGRRHDVERVAKELLQTYGQHHPFLALNLQALLTYAAGLPSANEGANAAAAP